MDVKGHFASHRHPALPQFCFFPKHARFLYEMFLLLNFGSVKKLCVAQIKLMLGTNWFACHQFQSSVRCVGQIDVSDGLPGHLWL